MASTSEERSAVRRALLAANFTRLDSTTDHGDGAYVEHWTSFDAADNVQIQWGPRA